MEQAKLDKILDNHKLAEKAVEALTKEEEVAYTVIGYLIQYGLDAIKMFVKTKTELDPVLALAITQDDLNDMQKEAQRYWDYLSKELVGEDNA